MSRVHQKLRLEFNPFEPSAAGPPLKSELSPPAHLQARVRKLLDAHGTGIGTKAIVAVGEYGMGKTCLLQWLHRTMFPDRRVKSFYFDNPGVHFYSLANTLLRTVGRKDFAKFIWELVAPGVSGYQKSLFRQSFEEYLFSQRGVQPREVVVALQRAILSFDITADEQIADCLARIVTDAKTKPYFEYRDFVPRQRGSVVAESEEAAYFRAILKVIARGLNAEAVAFLIDEFEEIGLQRRLTRREAHDYLVTLKRLINLAEPRGNDNGDFWIILSMTPEAHETTCKIEPALGERFAERTVAIEPLTLTEARAMVASRLNGARHASTESAALGLFPFPEEMVLRRETYSNPRRLVKTCFYAIADVDDDTAVPFSKDYLRKVEDNLYAGMDSGGRRS